MSDKGPDYLNSMMQQKSYEIMIPADNRLSFTVGDRTKYLALVLLLTEETNQII